MSIKVLTQKEVEQQFPAAYGALVSSDETAYAAGEPNDITTDDLVFWQDNLGRLNADTDVDAGVVHQMWDSEEKIWERVIG